MRSKKLKPSFMNNARKLYPYYNAKFASHVNRYFTCFGCQMCGGLSESTCRKEAWIPTLLSICILLCLFYPVGWFLARLSLLSLFFYLDHNSCVYVCVPAAAAAAKTPICRKCFHIFWLLYRTGVAMHYCNAEKILVFPYSIKMGKKK